MPAVNLLSIWFGKVVPTKLRLSVPHQSCFSSPTKHGERQVKAKFGFIDSSLGYKTEVLGPWTKDLDLVVLVL